MAQHEHDSGCEEYNTLTRRAFVGTAAAHEGKDGKDKKGKKAACSTEMKAHCSKEGASAATPSCCMKKGKTAAVKPADTLPAAAATKSL